LPLFDSPDLPRVPEPRQIISEEAVSTRRGSYTKLTGEFWTGSQQQMHSLHYIVSYRASFKPELPEYFIARHTKPGQVVLDPFNGRGTTALQANLMGRVAFGSDINPMSERIAYPKCNPVSLDELEHALSAIGLNPALPADGEDDFAMFYHPGTFREIVGLKNHLRANRGDADRFIELVALSRLHGHSPGFFSVYSFPQISVPPENQRKINEQRKQAPEYRAIKPRILAKARRALADGLIAHVRAASAGNRFETCDARKLAFPSACADLIVTSPPFLNKADYVMDNWLELWFLGIPEESVRGAIVQTSSLARWIEFMKPAIAEMGRVLRKGGVAVVEVGEVVSKGEVVNLDEVIVQMVDDLRSDGCKLAVEQVLIHVQEFTKLANCFKVDNNKKGTNTHRLVVMRKAG
ncbi:MAG TPA: DNA methyltransferase, partial [Planctomycetota bacterium]|nr:DNA methyltransferase [Planctomycetota bacterium]